MPIVGTPDIRLLAVPISAADAPKRGHGAALRGMPLSVR
jgi:hypothetical protein